jgi:hypothetical protein
MSAAVAQVNSGTLQSVAVPLAIVAHRRSAEGAIAVPAMPSTRAAPLDKSMQRPFTKGPRSFIRTVTPRPVECEVTVT